MINNVTIVGRITRDLELRYSESGVAVCNFTIAANRPFKSSDGQDADFINCVTFRKSAENLAQYMSKGSLIGITGRIQTRNYENEEKQRIFVTEVVADSVQFLESKSSNQSKPNNQQAQTNAYNKEVGVGQSDPFKDGGEPLDISDDDLPF